MSNKVIKNAAWIIGCRIVQSVLALIVTMISARYLGPSRYGLINYAASIVAFFVPIMQLGLNGTLVREILHDPEQEGEILGTSLGMSLISSIACLIGIGTFTAIANRGEMQTFWVCLLYSLLLIFRGLEMIQYWFQAKLMSKHTALTVLSAYILVAAYQITLLVTESSIYLFALSQAIDAALIAFGLLILYKKSSGNRLRFSWKRAKNLFNQSKYFIIPGLMVTIFAHTDRIMLKLMIDDAAVGFYSAAVACAGLTSFVFAAIIESGRPTIFEGKKQSDDVFCTRMKLLYAIVIGLALLQSGFITLFAKLIVTILYGSEYGEAVSALRIVVWYTTFSYMGSVRDVWILSEGKQKYLWIINLSGATANVVLNAFLIPLYGINGAAIASLLTQMFTNVVMGWIIPDIRPNNRLIIQSLNPKFIHYHIKTIIRERKI